MNKKLDNLYSLFIISICALGWLLIVGVGFVGNLWQKRPQKKIY